MHLTGQRHIPRWPVFWTYTHPSCPDSDLVPHVIVQQPICPHSHEFLTAQTFQDCPAQRHSVARNAPATSAARRCCSRVTHGSRARPLPSQRSSLGALHPLDTPATCKKGKVAIQSLILVVCLGITCYDLMAIYWNQSWALGDCRIYSVDSLQTATCRSSGVYVICETCLCVTCFDKKGNRFPWMLILG